MPWRKLPACESVGRGKLEACPTGRFSSAARLAALVFAPLAWLASLASAAEPPAGPLYAWYRDEGVKTDGPNVSAWENAHEQDSALENFDTMISKDWN